MGVRSMLVGAPLIAALALVGARGGVRVAEAADAGARAAATTAAPAPAPASPASLTGPEIVARVDARDDGRSVARTLEMELIDPDGTTRTRVTRSFRRTFDDGRRSVLFFEKPANVRGTALLTWDYADPTREDDQWLYLPALRKSRRVALADRGRAFLGTDFSFEDMKNETRLSATDFEWRADGEETVDGQRCLVIEGRAVSDATARALGYGRVRMRIDAALWLPRLGEYWTPDGTLLKRIRLLDIELEQGIWTPLRAEAENLQTGHRTTLRFRDVDYHANLPEDLFTEAALRRGLP